MDLTATLAGAAAAVLLALLFGWLGARKPDPSRGPRLAPWRFLMLASAAAAILLAGRLIQLAGFSGGR
jgi:multisubunit Na+/H+ antiporter MnhB subunit